MDDEPIPDTEVEGKGDTDGADGSFIRLDRASRSRSSRSNYEEYTGIVTPEPNQEFRPFLRGFLKLVRKIKKGTATERHLRTLPVGVRLINDGVIYLSSSRKYRETFEFEATGEELGTGISGPVRVVKDTMNAIEHALKSVHLSEFKENEIRCWIDQNKGGYVPKLYMFQVQNGHVLLHMEILKDVMTLKCLINTRHAIIRQPGNLLKPLALYIHGVVLAVIRKFHSTGWVHNDFHGGNVLLRIRANESPKVYLLDFGTADQSDYIQNDMQDIAGLLEGMLMGYENQTGKQQYSRIIFSDEDKTELANLIRKCSFLVQKSDLPQYIRLVEHSRRKAITAYISLADGGSEPPFYSSQIGDPLPSLPSPPRSPVSPTEDQKTKQFIVRDESLVSQLETRSNIEEYLPILATTVKTEGQAITAERETCSNFDGRGDENADFLAQPLDKLELGETEKTSTVSSVACEAANNDLVAYRRVHSDRSRKHHEKEWKEGSSDQDVKTSENDK